MNHNDISYFVDEITERNLLALLIADNRLIDIVKNYLNLEDFYYVRSRKIFNIIIDVYNRYGEASIKQIEEEVRKDKDVDFNGIMNYLNQGIEIVTSIRKNINRNLKIINNWTDYLKKLSRLREFLVYIDTNIKTNKSKVPNITEIVTNDVINGYYQKAFELINFRQSNIRQFTIEDLCNSYLQKFEDIRVNGVKDSILTNFTDLDKKLDGLHRADLILLAGRPSQGKTAFALNILRNIAIDNRKPVIFFSLEMGKEALIQRLISLETDINLQNLRSVNLNDTEIQQVYNATNKFKEAPIVIDDSPNLNIPNIKLKSIMHKNRFNELGCIIIDYLQLIEAKTAENRNYEISKITRALKQLAKEVDTPIILLSQLSRAVEQRQNHRPILSDLRDSGAIEQDADIVMFIYREHYYYPKEENINDIDIIIAKHRNGPTGTIHLNWEGECAKFSNI